MTLRDAHNRNIRDLRISLTDRCNFRCFYCLPNGEPPLAFADQPAEWVRVLTELWSNESARQKLGADARNWVTEHHTWDAAARAAAAGMRDESKSLQGTRG